MAVRARERMDAPSVVWMEAARLRIVRARTQDAVSRPLVRPMAPHCGPVGDALHLLAQGEFHVNVDTPALCHGIGSGTNHVEVERAFGMTQVVLARPVGRIAESGKAALVIPLHGGSAQIDCPRAEQVNVL